LPKVVDVNIYNREQNYKVSEVWMQIYCHYIALSYIFIAGAGDAAETQ